MIRFFVIALLALASSKAIAEEPLDPVATVKQLYAMTPRSGRTDASYGVWGDGSVNFSINYGTQYDRKTLYGHGSTPREALTDLMRQSQDLSKQIVPQAEKDRTAILSITDGVKAILFNKQPSQ